MKILAVGEFNNLRGSGWTTVLMGLLSEWEKRFYDVVVLGFDYQGNEHPFNAAVLPTDNNLWAQQSQMVLRDFRPDVIVVTFDLSLHHGLRALQTLPIPYVGVFVVESDPVIHPSDWTNCVDTMDIAFCLTKFGADLMNEHGLRVRHLPPGVDEFWRPPTAEERDEARRRWGVGDRFVVLSNMDSHERKNLPAHCAAVALATGRTIEWPPLLGPRTGLHDPIPELHWILNTKKRPKSVSWMIYDLVKHFGIEDRTLILEHQPGEGLAADKLRELYWAADAFMLLSKAEGFGLPILEAMACGVPVLGTETSGIREQIGAADNRGFLIPAEYVNIDPFGNQYRRHADPWHAAYALASISRVRPLGHIERALAHAREQTWKRAGDIFSEALNELTTTQAQRSPASTAGTH